MSKNFIITFSLACLLAASSQAGDTKQISSVAATLAAAPAAELPAKAAELVKRAKARDWGTTTVNVIQAAIEVSPGSASAVVGAVSRAVPAMASVAAGTAAELQPRQAAAIAKAAAAAAPAKVGKIVTAVCRVAPREYRAVALAASEAVPGSNLEILGAVGFAIPDLRPSIDRLLSRSSASGLPMGVALTQVKSTPATTVASSSSSSFSSGSSSSGATLRGPTVGPPYIPLSGTPGTVTPGSGTTVPPGGRGYAAP